MLKVNSKLKNLGIMLVFILLLSTLLVGCENASSESKNESKDESSEFVTKLATEWKDDQPIGAVTQWSRSKHAEVGTTCSDCHGDDPSNLSIPSAATCAQCHTEQYDDFNMSTHSTAVVHAMSKDSATYFDGREVDYKWQSYPEGGPDKWGCVNCHSVGKIHEETEVLGDCSACHGNHEFSLIQARNPDTCNGCHAGPGHPQYESYVDSRHGVLWSSLGDQWDFSGSTEEFWERQEENPIGAPTCQTCHMPEGSHNTAHGQAHELTGARVDNYEEEITFMVDNSCLRCHTDDFSREWLGNADNMASVSSTRLKEAKELLEGIKKDGLIRSTVEVVNNAHPIAGELSAVESYFFNVNMSTNRTRKGAYHMSEQWAGRQGWTDQSFALMEFRSEVERLRSDAERDKKIKELEELIKLSEDK
ncbi:MAG: hypothetical protein GX787_05600 [Tissierellia bacterium]|nr:hypothetical protein [Tissierellia bacterium]